MSSAVLAWTKHSVEARRTYQVTGMVGNRGFWIINLSGQLDAIGWLPQEADSEKALGSQWHIWEVSPSTGCFQEQVPYQAPGAPSRWDSGKWHEIPLRVVPPRGARPLGHLPATSHWCWLRAVPGAPVVGLPVGRSLQSYGHSCLWQDPEGQVPSEWERTGWGSDRSC